MKQEDIKSSLLKQVFWNNQPYIMTECILWLNKQEQKFQYSCVLLDKNSNSTVRVRMEEVDTQ